MLRKRRQKTQLKILIKYFLCKQQYLLDKLSSLQEVSIQRLQFKLRLAKLVWKRRKKMSYPAFYCRERAVRTKECKCARIHKKTQIKNQLRNNCNKVVYISNKTRTLSHKNSHQELFSNNQPKKFSKSPNKRFKRQKRALWSCSQNRIPQANKRRR